MRIVDTDVERDGFFWIETLPVKRDFVPLQDGLDGWWGELTFELTTHAQLFIGSGEVAVENGQMYFCFARRGDRYAIPATSLKGALRSLAELISPSCIAVVDDTAYTQHCQIIVQSQPSLCPACGVFGMLGYRGRVSFDDALVMSFQRKLVTHDHRTEAKRTEPDDAGPFQFRKLYARDHGSNQLSWREEKERLEVLEAVTCQVRLSFHHLREWELGLLILALGVAPQHEFHFKLGGGKNRGMGLVNLSLINGKCAEGKSWFFGQRQIVTSETIVNWFRAYEHRAKQWNIWNSVQQAVRYLQRVYSYGA